MLKILWVIIIPVSFRMLTLKHSPLNNLEPQGVVLKLKKMLTDDVKQDREIKP